MSSEIFEFQIQLLQERRKKIARIIEMGRNLRFYELGGKPDLEKIESFMCILKKEFGISISKRDLLICYTRAENHEDFIDKIIQTLFGDGSVKKDVVKAIENQNP